MSDIPMELCRVPPTVSTVQRNEGQYEGQHEGQHEGQLVNQCLKRNINLDTAWPGASKFARILKGNETIQSQLLFDNINQGENSDNGCHGDVQFELPVPSALQDKFMTQQQFHSSNISPYHMHSSNVSPYQIQNSSVSPYHIHSSNVSPYQMHSSNVSAHHIQNSNISPYHIHSSNVSPHHIQNSNVSPYHIHNSNVSPHHIQNSNISPYHIHSSNVSPYHIQNSNVSPHPMNNMHFEETVKGSTEAVSSFVLDTHTNLQQAKLKSQSPTLSLHCLPSHTSITTAGTDGDVASTARMAPHTQSQVSGMEGFEEVNASVLKHIKTEPPSLDALWPTADSPWSRQIQTSVPFHGLHMQDIQSRDNYYKHYGASNVQCKTEPVLPSAEYGSNGSSNVHNLENPYFRNPYFARSSGDDVFNMHCYATSSPGGHDSRQVSATNRSHLVQPLSQQCHQMASRCFSDIDSYYNQPHFEDSVPCAPTQSMARLPSQQTGGVGQGAPFPHPECQRGVFQFRPATCPLSIADQYILVEKMQCEQLREICLPQKVAYVYNPLEYAFETHYNFIEKFCNTQKKILFLGMNAGPWGMSQNGVPFGEVNIVKDWMKITGDILKPHHEHPSRLVKGLECPRSEVSGKRFWGFFQQVCETPETFFTNCFVHNICPLAFMSCTGKNITPPMLGSATLKILNLICDKALLKVLALLNISTIVSVGQFAHKRATSVVTEAGIDTIRLVSIMHPSPCNPNANKGWFDITLKNLQELKVLDCITNP